MLPYHAVTGESRPLPPSRAEHPAHRETRKDERPLPPQETATAPMWSKLPTIMKMRT
jgi:hypothetical protein